MKLTSCCSFAARLEKPRYLNLDAQLTVSSKFQPKTLQMFFFYTGSKPSRACRRIPNSLDSSGVSASKEEFVFDLIKLIHEYQITDRAHYPRPDARPHYAKPPRLSLVVLEKAKIFFFLPRLRLHVHASISRESAAKGAALGATDRQIMRISPCYSYEM